MKFPKGRPVKQPSFRFQPRAGQVFLEPPELEGALGMALKVDRVLESRRTPFQELHVVEAGPLGRVLILDGNIQITQMDEPGYHEMIAHVPLLSHPHPRRVLIIGGGDGGALREVLRHPQVEKAELCEIDEEVIQASRRWFPELACAFDHPKARVRVEDGIKLVSELPPESFEVIIVDSSDPEGPALPLFGRQFFSHLRRALSPGGVVVSQAECFALYPQLLGNLFAFLPELFERAYYYMSLVPSYLGGQMGFAFSSLGPDPLAPLDPARVAALGPLKYYTPALHRAAFALPRSCLNLLPPEVAARQGG